MKLPSIILAVILFCLPPFAHAHMMVAQHGTLNVVGDGAFLVLSMPASAFTEADIDKDGYLSETEFSNHRVSIATVIEENLLLKDASGSCALQGIMLSPVSDHGTTSGLSSQVIVMGRFALNDPEAQHSFEVGAFGEGEGEDQYKITATQPSQNRLNTFLISPIQPSSALFD